MVVDLIDMFIYWFVKSTEIRDREWYDDIFR